MAWPKIIYPSQPAIPNPPAASAVSGGSLPARTYYWRVSYVTPYGVSLPCPEQSLAIPANDLCQIASPAPPSAPTIAVGWNIYASTTQGAETLQNPSGLIAIGTAWTEPTSGLISGAALPTTWGATLTFQRPARKIPYDWAKATRHDSISTAGAMQTIAERLEKWLSFEVEWIGVGSDVAAWSAFIDQAALGVPFDYYPDASLANYITYRLMEPDKALAYKVPGQYTIALTFRQEMQLVNPPVTVPCPPTQAARWVTFTTPGQGNFTLAHPLGYSPNGAAGPLMTSAGAVWFQAAMWDKNNLYLVASDQGLTGMVLVW
jgi:hypothetical protein